MLVLFLGYVLVIQRSVKCVLGGQFFFAETLPSIHAFPFGKSVGVVSFYASWLGYSKLSGESKLSCTEIKAGNETQHPLPLKSWCTCPYCLGCNLLPCPPFLPYPKQKMRIMPLEVVQNECDWTSGLIRSFGLQGLWASPRYFPVKWQWSLTVSL